MRATPAQWAAVDKTMRTICYPFDVVETGEDVHVLPEHGREHSAGRCWCIPRAQQLVVGVLHVHRLMN
jgi:hypothetical protein